MCVCVFVCVFVCAIEIVCDMKVCYRSRSRAQKAKKEKTHAHTHTHTHKQTYTHTYTHTQTHTHTHAHTHTNIHTYTHTHTHTHTYTHAHTHTHTHTGMYTHTHKRWTPTHFDLHVGYLLSSPDHPSTGPTSDKGQKRSWGATEKKEQRYSVCKSARESDQDSSVYTYLVFRVVSRVVSEKVINRWCSGRM